MSKVTVKSPSPTYTGITAGVSFVDGEGTFDPSRQHAAARYFDRHGYTYPRAAEQPETIEPAESEPESTEPADGEQTEEPTAEPADTEAEPAESEPAPAAAEPAKPARSAKAGKTAGD